MSGIVLSASVRQNLLSLQSTAALLATTQNDLATGNKVNSALDNPTEFFTAQGLSNRASDINNLLDGIGNGVQVLQAANTGITSLQSYISTAQSIANQVLQAPTGYSTKSSVTATAITGATADNLLGTTGANATALEAAIMTGNATPTAATATTPLGGTAGTLSGTAVDANVSVTGTALAAGTVTGATALSGLTTPPAAGNSLLVDGKTITFAASPLSPATGSAGNTADGNVQVAANGNVTVSVGGTVQDVLDAINLATGAQTASIDTTSHTATLSTVAGKPTASISGTGAITIGGIGSTALTIGAGGTALAALGLSAVAASTTASTAITSATKLTGATGALSSDPSTFAAGDTLNVNGNTVSFVSTPPTTGYTKVTAGDAADGTPSGNVYVGADGSVQIVASSTTTVGDVMAAIDLASGVQTYSVTGTGATATATASVAPGQTASSISTTAPAGEVTLQSSTGSDLNITASNAADLTSLGLTATSTTPTGGATFTAARTASTTGLGSLISAGSSLTVDGKTITFANTLPVNTPAGSGVSPSGNIQTDGNGNSIVSLSTGTMQDVLDAIDLATGVQTASITPAHAATLSTTPGDTVSSLDANGKLNINTGTAQNLTIAVGPGNNPGNALAALGLTAGTTADSSLQGQTLTFAATGTGTGSTITFGTGAGQVSTLNQLNTALAGNDLQASIDASGVITITTTNNAASATIGTIGGTATGAGSPFAAFAGIGGPDPVLDPTSQAARASLVAQYNNVMAQINTTAQDSSFNGINLLNGDTLNLTFDETGASKLAIQGFTFDDAGLGLSDLTAGTDFVDSNSANTVLATLNQASTTLRTAASSLGSNLSVVQIRQDFNKSLINVLQTGASNLTVADPNEEAANSQALSTRQSIAVSALALANQSQQSVLQLLR
ncbi:DUF1522 domain-containing protein [Bradyrhizobium sp. dw_78]|uniref:DUF1522 domain-containing protein n=1 Tax=Bradyrhizobium sp. dw_78 TaxID=2719793 RepID=UPI001BD2C05E|nr:DUF1522 domain-containing protein [Bradyrhizobium sp. dw_78]